MKVALYLKRDISLVVILSVWLFVLIFVVACTLNSSKVSSEERKIPIYSVDTQEKSVALTFNCAWNDVGSEELLGILKDKNISCTFFFVGEFCEKYPELVKRICDDGHEIANHSMHHKDPVKQEYTDILSDIDLCNGIIYGITNTKPSLYRAPSGSYDNKTVEAAQNLGMNVIQWDVDSIDWKNPSGSDIVKRVTSKVQNGSIVLFHLGKENTVQALPEIIDILKSEGFSFSTVSDMLIEGETYIDNFGRQHQYQ